MYVYIYIYIYIYIYTRETKNKRNKHTTVPRRQCTVCLGEKSKFKNP